METMWVLNSVFLWIVVLFNLLLTLALIRRLNAGKAELKGPYDDLDLLESLKPAPDFQAETLAGKMVTLSSYAGRMVAFVFFNLGCATCVDKLAEIAALVPEAREQGLEIVLVNKGDPFNQVREFFKAHYPNLAVLLPRSAFADDYKVPGIPFFCQVSHEGRVIVTGYLDHRWEHVLNQMREGLFLNGKEAFSSQVMDQFSQQQAQASRPKREVVVMR